MFQTRVCVYVWVLAVIRPNIQEGTTRVHTHIHTTNFDFLSTICQVLSKDLGTEAVASRVVSFKGLTWIKEPPFLGFLIMNLLEKSSKR